MKVKLGYLIKNNNNNYTVIVPNWIKKSKYIKIQLNIKKNYLYDNRNELLDNFKALVRFNEKKKTYNLIKILN